MRANGTIDRLDDRGAVRIDLHLHSHASGMATNWWVKGLGLGLETRESYTAPEDAYRLAKAAGMDFVTLTDHESIEGALTLTDHPDFLVGVEVSTVIPEDGDSVDVLVFGLNADQHRELQARRPDVHRLVNFLRESDLVHVLAHPMFEIGRPLDRAAIEKRAVLFGLWEFVNGSRPGNQNRLARQLAGEIGPAELRQLARRHGLPIPPHRSIAGTGGSDDHGGVYVGATYTLVPRVMSVADLLAAMRAGEVQPGGEDGSVEKMAHTGFRIAAAAYGEARQRGDDAPSTALARGQAEKLMEYLPLVASLEGSQLRALLVGQYERKVGGALEGAGGGAILSLLGSIGGFVDGHLFVAPYLATHGYFGRERQKTRELRRRLRVGQPEHVRVGVFVDDLDEIHGVATMYRNLQRRAAVTGGDSLQLVHCGGEEEVGAIRLRPIATMPLPLYAGRTLSVPSVLDVLDHVSGEGYDVIHVATPGPLGIAALVAGVTLGLPIVGVYHTEFGAYARALSGDALVAELVEVLVRQFYERCAVVAVPSAATAAALAARGYRIGRFEVLRNGVDTALYHPERRSEARRLDLGGGRTLLLYAGRVSREKGLEGLATGYLELRSRRADVHLVVVGDGPYRAEMEALLGETATFTGFLRGEELAATYAAADVFVFPSTTDTLGRAVAEAQAAGAPAVVYGMGGPRECLRPGESGFVVEVGDEAGFWGRAEELVDNPKLRRRMGRAARAFALTLSWDEVLAGLLALYRDVAGVPRPETERQDVPLPDRLAALVATAPRSVAGVGPVGRRAG